MGSWRKRVNKRRKDSLAARCGANGTLIAGSVLWRSVAATEVVVVPIVDFHPLEKPMKKLFVVPVAAVAASLAAANLAPAQESNADRTSRQTTVSQDKDQGCQRQQSCR